MPSSTSATMLFPFIMYVKLSLPGFIGLYHLSGEFNPADIMTKHWGYQTIWRLLQLLLFYQGDTADLFED